MLTDIRMDFGHFIGPPLDCEPALNRRISTATKGSFIVRICNMMFGQMYP
jgi:hypothetical protein